MLLSTAVLIAGFHDDKLERFRTPAAAILGLSFLLSIVCGLCVLFTELKVQDENKYCHQFHLCICCCTTDTEDFPALKEIMMNTNVDLKNNKQSTMFQNQPKISGKQDMTSCQLLVINQREDHVNILDMKKYVHN